MDYRKRNNIVTTIDQSKELLKLGLESQTSDMYYEEPYAVPVIIPYDLKDLNYFTDPKKIPAWSLSGLINLLPRIIDIEDDDEYFLTISPRNNKEWAICYENIEVPGFIDYCQLVEFTDENLITIVFNTICWLLKNNYKNLIRYD